MGRISSYESFEAVMRNVAGKPVVLEALWDGDTQGWYLCLSIYCKNENDSSGLLFEQGLGHVTFGGDIRLFTGEVPAWPEAALAKEIGKKAEEQYGLTFYFPSPNEPDDDCPSWNRRHLAIHCEDCNKLIIPTTSPYLPKEICYNCHLTREQNARLKNAQPCDDGVNMVLYKDGIIERQGYATYFKSFPIYPFVKDDIPEIRTPNAISIFTIAGKKIEELKEKLKRKLEQSLLLYEKPVVKESERKFMLIQKKIFRNVEYEFAIRSNQLHMELYNLIPAFETAEKALAEGWEYRIYFKSGFTYRDDSLLRFVNYPKKGKATRAAINERYAKILNEQEISETIHKLIEWGCLEMSGDEVTVTQLGNIIV